MDNLTLNTLKEIDSIEIASSILCDSAEVSNHIKIAKNDLTIISKNIRSIYSNFDDFSQSCLSFDTDVILLTECRLDPNKPIPQLNSYCSYFTTCYLNQNDGVVITLKIR